MSANAGALHLPQHRVISRKARMAAIAVAFMVAAGAAAYLSLNSANPTTPARSATAQVHTAPQAVPGYQSWIRARESAGMPAIIRLRTKATAMAAQPSVASAARRHHQAIAVRPVASMISSSAAEVCPLGRLGPC